MNHSIELVRLMDDEGNDVGVADKRTVHTSTTPLHLAFSCHIFDRYGRTLVTRRALTKPTWPGVWTNSFCGHPAPGESMEDAIRRRADEELRMTISAPTAVLPDFRYRAVDASGIVENEICPVYRADYPGDPQGQLDPHPGEVSEWAWLEPAKLAQSVTGAPFAFSPWLVSQLEQGLYSPAGAHGAAE
ncbi:isopentenyl-diphosphate Delta-isomerase [Arthrobacter sp. H14-L1]|uniref:isopentenyl-diphosphate Delta-isomerase n=1 Tax=Arthrobacter sp. H14-L1 TaxID=2996697 RepID=UPI00227146C5|nr:isopentenyl-diphosphate Delta-isomerase [Arthrobacter sp. H14-L1]MCY0903691.1 isopentenyl-diphosphate Delta-isomerase [Arthrobacter sp. H14-L1]